jgi:hypothetical protein
MEEDAIYFSPHKKRDMTKKGELTQLRDEIARLQAQVVTKREELYQRQKQLFRECVHEWVKEEEQGEGGSDGFWYGYCPYTCKHCGHFKSGPVKL